METSTNSGTDFGRLVWISDATSGFVAARIADITQNGFELVTEGDGRSVGRRFEETFACEEEPSHAVDDNCALVHLNEATLLNNCRLRYRDRKIYSYVANILISINPYEPIRGLYSSETVKAYRGASLGQREPHIFAIADKAYREMRRDAKNQSIIVSGESGAGKTESQKAILKYLCENWATDADAIQRRLLETNPILEAFGNAKTLRNNNSSRFGKFVQIYFDEKGSVAGGFVSHYLLETSRVCRQSSGERNYHIFYQLIAGASEELYRELKLAPPHSFNYLKHGANVFFAPSSGSIPPNRCSPSTTAFSRDPIVDDRNDFAKLENALRSTGIAECEVQSIWRTVAGILHLGNVEFEESAAGGCQIAAVCDADLDAAAEFLGLERDEMRLGLCARWMQATRGGGVQGTLIRVPLAARDAAAGRDALAKCVYTRLFDWLVARLNRSIPFGARHAYIGVLDVAGFEFFARNSFEQFCINYCNERLQHFFNARILRDEQELYRRERLDVRTVEFVDNRDCIELFERRRGGLFELLDEEARLPRPSFQHFTHAALDANRGHFRLDVPRKSKIKAHREMRDDEGLLIRHYAGTVCYETRRFVDKNNDQLHNSLRILIEQSRSPLVAQLFDDDEKRGGVSGGRLKSASVGAKFKSQLAALVEKLDETGTSFVRCVKPNNQMTPWHFDGAAILSQLQCAGMGSVLRLMQHGFPSRCSFRDLYAAYKTRLPPNLARLEPRLFSKCLFRALGLNPDDFQFGETKVFFRAGKFAEFDQMMRQDPESMKELIEKVNDWLVKARWRHAQYGVWMVIKLKNKLLYRAERIRRIQAWMRGHLVRRRFQKRLVLYRKACALLEHSREMTDILARLNETSQEKWRESAMATSSEPAWSELEHLVVRIKCSMETGAEQHDVEHAVRGYEQCLKRVDTIIAELKSQLESDDLAEVERRRAEEEQKEQKEQQERAQLEQDRLSRRKMEEERERAQKEYEAHVAAQSKQHGDEALRAEKELEQERERTAEQQRRLDTIVASRLANCDGLEVLHDTVTVMPVTSSSGGVVKNAKFDLSHWKYVELRDAINTSNDMELLVACKEEFHRRLRIYNEWKTSNSASRDIPPHRVPLTVFNNQQKSTSSSLMSFSHVMAAPHLNPALTQQRYFKVSFPTDKNGTQSGMWYAHFNGQYIQRQLTLRPSQRAQLLVAGKDDLQMCELPLEQTGLLRKKGAEISVHDFDTMWHHYGGKPVNKWTP